MTEKELKRGVRKESVSSQMQQFLENKKEALRLGVHNTRWNLSPQGGLG